MHEVLVNRLGGLSLPRKSVVRLTDRPDMTLDVYRGRKITMQQQQQSGKVKNEFLTSSAEKSLGLLLLAVTPKIVFQSNKANKQDGNYVLRGFQSN